MKEDNFKFDFELDKDNVEFFNAVDLVRHTNNLLYVTGKAGTGKTTFLKYIKATKTKKTVIVAPTGIAALNAGGVTMHSFFRLPFGPFVPNDKRLRIKVDKSDEDKSTIYSTFPYNNKKKDLINNLELLLIDEISMVRVDLLDVIDRILRVYRNKLSQPFGGVQVVLIGDAFQLPPVAEKDVWDILKRFYESPFFFSSKVYKENKYFHIELKKIYRQTDENFIELLNKIRINDITGNDLEKLHKKYLPDFIPDKNDNFIIIATHNVQVDDINYTKLNELKTELYSFQGVVNGEFPKDSNGNYILPAEMNLQLKVGAQVMFIKNDSGQEKRYVNGSIGKIKELDSKSISVEFPNKTCVSVSKETWENIKYEWNAKKNKIEEKVIGTYIQYPLKLAWAITVHKSQGLTFEKVIADLGGAFENGQVYVALSRCVSLQGLILKSQINRRCVKTHSSVIEFAKTETPNTLIIEELKNYKADELYKKCREAIKVDNFSDAYDYLIEAINYRNDINTETAKRYFKYYLSKQSFLKNIIFNNEITIKEDINKLANNASESSEYDYYQREEDDYYDDIDYNYDDIDDKYEREQQQLFDEGYIEPTFDDYARWGYGDDDY